MITLLRQSVNTMFTFGSAQTIVGEMGTIVFTRPATVLYTNPTFEAYLNNVTGATGIVQIFGSVSGACWGLVGTLNLSGANAGDTLTPEIDFGYQVYKAVIPADGITGANAAITAVVGF